MQHGIRVLSSLRQGDGLRRGTMKNKIMAAVLAAILLVSGLTGCSTAKKSKIKTRIGKTRETTEEPGETDETEDTEKPTFPTDPTTGKDPGADLEIDPEEPLFMEVYMNYAWGYSVNAMVVMGNGDVYNFGCGTMVYPPNGLTNDLIEYLGDKLDRVRALGKPIGKVDEDYLNMLFKKAGEIDLDSDILSENVMCDYGEYEIFFLQTANKDDNKLIYGYGDNDIILDDKAAEDFKEMFELLGSGDSEQFTITDDTYYSIYTGEFPICSFNCGYVSVPDDYGFYVFPDRESFMEAMDQLGIDKTEFAVFDEPAYEENPYFVKITDVPSSGYMLLSDAFVVESSGDNRYFYFLESDDSYRPDEDSTQCAVMDGFISVCCYTGYVDLDELVNDDSNLWQYFESDN